MGNAARFKYDYVYGGDPTGWGHPGGKGSIPTSIGIPTVTLAIRKPLFTKVPLILRCRAILMRLKAVGFDMVPCIFCQIEQGICMKLDLSVSNLTQRLI